MQYHFTFHSLTYIHKKEQLVVVNTLKKNLTKPDITKGGNDFTDINYNVLCIQSLICIFDATI